MNPHQPDPRQERAEVSLDALDGLLQAMRAEVARGRYPAVGQLARSASGHLFDLVEMGGLLCR